MRTKLSHFSRPAFPWQRVKWCCKSVWWFLHSTSCSTTTDRVLPAREYEGQHRLTLTKSLSSKLMDVLCMFPVISCCSFYVTLVLSLACFSILWIMWDILNTCTDIDSKHVTVLFADTEWKCGSQGCMFLSKKGHPKLTHTIGWQTRK